MAEASIRLWALFRCSRPSACQRMHSHRWLSSTSRSISIPRKSLRETTPQICPLPVVKYQHRAGATLPHVPAGFLHRLALCQRDQLLAFDDTRELSVDYSPSLCQGGPSGWALRFLEASLLPHRDRLEIDPRQKLIGLEGAHCAVGTIRVRRAAHMFPVSLLGDVRVPVQSAKFPVPILREFGEKALNLFANGRAASR